ncbi:MarR family transcriptional regulator [Roseibium porphyridii]|uniref:MarR family transcriptional regulator n=1 Tax=Roseibium porphyridii TaxID=2866279 RepID=A0ABY8F8D6_9HYPH|nr:MULTISPECIES: MarR family transcriptional regulator [Stappiaceae]QFT30855.1 MarR family protein [Labrenzia sp. THAF82]WFE91476.1 MarR family transcriptional regulator [Roseibium sp. KMA01]
MNDKKPTQPPFASIRGLVFDLAEQLDKRMIELRQGTGLDAARPADANLFMMICRNPRTISELARDKGISRQAVHSAVSRLVDLGALRLEPVPGSKRDKLPVPTELGQEARVKVAGLLKQMESELEEAVGTDDLERLRALLIKLVATQKSKDVQGKR